MRKLNFIVAVLLISPSIFFVSCKKETGCTDPVAINFNPEAEEDCCCVYDSDFAKERYAASINFEHFVNGTAVDLTANNHPYQNELGQNFEIDDLRYLISDLTFHQANGESFTINDYHFIDLSKPNTLVYQPSVKVPAGNYTSISFTFGFDKYDNIPGHYPDLNAEGWNWPMMGMDLGYHYLQINGSYDSSGTAKGFMTHMGPAMKMDGAHHTVVNNEFEVVLTNADINVGNNFGFNIIMNVEEWYTNPYNWDFNMYNTNVMMNYDAQRLLNINGPSVFSFGGIVPPPITIN